MSVICNLLQLYLLIIFVRIVLSWFPTPGEGAMASIQSFLFALTEPVLAPLRAVLPPVQLGAAALDLSPIIVTLAIIFLTGFIC